MGRGAVDSPAAGLDSEINGAPEGQAMDEQDTTHTLSVGDQLRIAREKMGLSLEDVASQTRIPRRHLEKIESEDWESLPAPTYTIGFAKSYASAVGLDRAAIGEQLREEIGGVRAAQAAPEYFEPADPARSMPKGLVIGAIIAVLLVVLLFSWLDNRSLDSTDDAAPAGEVAVAAPMTPAPALVAPAATGPVILTAVEPVWIRVYEKGGPVLFERVLGLGERFRVPPTATAPLLRTGKPEALKITVGNATAPAVGPAASTVRDVSLLGPDLMRNGQPAGQQAQAAEPRANTTTSTPRAQATAPPAAAPQAKTVENATANTAAPLQNTAQ
jgi:transcriptional regulator with XRE-family HTH domain